MKALVIAAIAIASISNASAQTTPPYHMSNVFAQRVRCTQDYQYSLPNGVAAEWTVRAASPPDTGVQLVESSWTEIVGSDDPTINSWEESAEHRPILIVKHIVAPSEDPHSLHFRVHYLIDLYRRTILQGAPADPIAPLGDDDAKLYTSDTATMNYNDPAFQAWLDKLSLRRRVDENELDFAWRVFSTIRANFEYRYVEAQIRKASMLCAGEQTDCGGMSVMFVSALRANHIPARLTVGALAYSDPYDAHHGDHVRSEVFVSGIGWIPVDQAEATAQRSQDMTQFFGHDQGNFITFHFDVDISWTSKRFGAAKRTWLQVPSVESWGTGTATGSTITEKWTVEPLATKVQGQ